VDGAKYLTVLDANQGYFQLPLTEDTKQCTVLAAPEGTLRYKKSQMGITSAPELFQRKFHDVHLYLVGLKIYLS